MFFVSLSHFCDIDLCLWWLYCLETLKNMWNCFGKILFAAFDTCTHYTPNFASVHTRTILLSWSNFAQFLKQVSMFFNYPLFVFSLTTRHSVRCIVSCLLCWITNVLFLAFLLLTNCFLFFAHFYNACMSLGEGSSKKSTLKSISLQHHRTFEQGSCLNLLS